MERRAAASELDTGAAGEAAAEIGKAALRSSAGGNLCDEDGRGEAAAGEPGYDLLTPRRGPWPGEDGIETLLEDGRKPDGPAAAGDHGNEEISEEDARLEDARGSRAGKEKEGPEPDEGKPSSGA